jgi:ATP-dependent Clp protease ATP-binding subunit ClpA
MIEREGFLMIPAYLTEGTSTIVQQIVESAFKVAGERKHRTVSPSHVLKGLHLVQCRAQQVLRACLNGEAYDNLERKVDASIEPGTAAVDVPQSVSPKVDSIFKRARVLAKNLGISKAESIHLLLSFLLENDCNPQVLLAGAGITTSAIILECSRACFQESDSKSEDRTNEVGDVFSRLVNLLSAAGTQPSLLLDFITLCEKNGLWKEELLRPFYLFAATQEK